MHAIYSHTENTYVHKNESKHREMAMQLDKTQCICMCIALCKIVAHNIAQNRPDNFPLTLQTITTHPICDLRGLIKSLLDDVESRRVPIDRRSEVGGL